MSGKIIVIEGMEHDKKENQVHLLEEKLKENNIKCIRFEFPMYNTPTGKIVDMANITNNSKTIFKEGAVNVDPYVTSLYYAADRKYNMKEINKYLDDGYYVILDRYVPSNLAFQGSKIKDKDKRFEMYQWIDKLEYWLLKLPKPDITIFLKIPLDYLNKDSGEEYLKDTLDAYIELSELYNWDVVDCIKDNRIRDKKDINEEIFNIVIKKEN